MFQATMLQREFFSRVDSDDTPELRALQERFNTLEVKESDAREKAEETSSEDAGVLKAIEEAEERKKKSELQLTELENRRNFHRSEAEALRPEVEGLAAKVQTSIEAYKGSEDFEEENARSYLRGFWYGNEMAHKAHPSWEFNLGGILMPEEVVVPLRRIQAKEAMRGEGSSRAKE